MGRVGELGWGGFGAGAGHCGRETNMGQAMVSFGRNKYIWVLGLKVAGMPGARTRWRVLEPGGYIPLINFIQSLAWPGTKGFQPLLINP